MLALRDRPHAAADPMQRLEAAIAAASDEMPHNHRANRLTIELNAAFAALKTSLEDAA